MCRTNLNKLVNGIENSSDAVSVTISIKCLTCVLHFYLIRSFLINNILMLKIGIVTGNNNVEKAVL